MEGQVHEFKEKFTIEQRKSESEKKLKKHPNRIPIIIEKAKTSKIVDDIDTKKFLVPGDLTMGQLMYVVRKRIKNVTSETGLFFFINNTMPPTGEILNKIYATHKDEDGFLYVHFTGENTFG